MTIKTFTQIIAFITLFIFPEQTNAVAPGAGDGGCCIPDSMIAHMAEAYDVEGSVALDMMDRLSQETFADLRLLQSTPAQACEVYLMCEEIPEEFFRVLLTETIERIKALELKASQRRAFIFTLLTAIIAVTGLTLSAFNTWQNSRKSKE